MNRLPGGLVGALVIVPVAGLAILYAWPFATLVIEAVDKESIRSVLGRSRTWSIVWFTTWQAVVSTLLTVIVGFSWACSPPCSSCPLS